MAGEGRGALSRKPGSGTPAWPFLPAVARRARVTGTTDGIGSSFPRDDGGVKSGLTARAMSRLKDASRSLYVEVLPMSQRATDALRASIDRRVRCLLLVGFLALGLSDREVWAQELPAPAAAVDPLEQTSAPIAASVARLTQAPVATAPGRSFVGRHPVFLGTGIGAAAAAVWQTSACRRSACNTGAAALVGAGVGAYTGLVVSAVQHARAGRPVSRRVKIGLAAGAIGAVAGGWLACYGAGGCGGVS